MGNYVKITDFAIKDSLLTGNPLKLITGTAHDNEYNAIATAIATKVDSGGALGTPTSGTLTNCTGLPQSGTVGLTTSDSPQFAGVNIGHASDTTITRASAGTVAVEGVNILTTTTGAALAGSASQTFSVALATAAAHAVRSDQLSADNANFPIYSAGTVTLTLTGCTTSPTIDFKYVKIGKSVTLSPAIDNITATSNSTAKTLTGLPSSLAPSAAYLEHALASDNGGAAIDSAILLASSGVITLYPDNVGTAWTASGVMAFYPNSYTFVTA